jgi:hypothetical protein
VADRLVTKETFGGTIHRQDILTKGRREKMMKKAIMVMVLVLVIAVPLAVLAGCGSESKTETETSSTSDLEKQVDTALRQAYQGNGQALVNLLPPDMREQYGELFTQGMPENGGIIEAHYRTEQTDATHAIVYFWGTVEYEVGGQKQSETITEAEAQPLPMVLQDGQWYIDINTMMQQVQQQMQQQPGTTQTP